jgi:hypothetical protein
MEKDLSCEQARASIGDKGLHFSSLVSARVRLGGKFSAAMIGPRTPGSVD